ncbi:hypothetical protein [Mycobacterium camsae]|uniref:hypothetical protein n=1 Tax=Mycobacterium gordonae TaxID=1778 RepID=UPI00197FC931|nr:hypothetical protein [Mycobacterium gordonae]
MDPALGDLIRRNIGTVAVRAARRITLLAIVLGVLMSVVWSLRNDGHSTVTPRLIGGLVIMLLLATISWYFRPIPPGLLKTVFRQHGYLAVRLSHAFLTVLLAGCVVVFGGPDLISKSGVLLATSGVLFAFAGLMTGN